MVNSNSEVNEVHARILVTYSNLITIDLLMPSFSRCLIVMKQPVAGCVFCVSDIPIFATIVKEQHSIDNGHEISFSIWLRIGPHYVTLICFIGLDSVCVKCKMKLILNEGCHNNTLRISLHNGLRTYKIFSEVTYNLRKMCMVRNSYLNKISLIYAMCSLITST